MAFGFDPSIILSATRTQEPTPNETLRTLADLAGSRMQQRQAQASLADLARQRGREDELADVYRQGAGNMASLPQLLMSRGFGAQAFGAQDQTAQLESKKAERDKAYADIQAAQRKQMGDLFYGVKDQAGWEAAVQAAPEMYRGMLPAKFNPEVAQRLAALAVPAATRAQIDATAAGAKDRRAFEAAERAKDRANRTTNAGIIAGRQKAAADAKAAGDFNDDVDAFRKEISSNKQVAKYRQASAELASLEELAKDSTGANDMAIVFAFMKALDPDSAVREAEYNAAASTGTPDQRMMGLVSKYWTGGPLSPGQRQAFIKAARAAQSGHKAAYEKAAGDYRYTAKKRGYDLRDLGLEESAPKRSAAGVDLTKPVEKVVNGKTYVMDEDGDWTVEE